MGVFPATSRFPISFDELVLVKHTEKLKRNVELIKYLALTELVESLLLLLLFWKAHKIHTDVSQDSWSGIGTAPFSTLYIKNRKLEKEGCYIYQQPEERTF